MSDDTKMILKRKSSNSSTSKNRNVKKVFANKLPVATTTVAKKDRNDDDNDNDNFINGNSSSSSSRSLSFKSYLDSMAILGHDKTALFATFGLFLLSLLVSMYMNNQGHGQQHSSFKDVMPSWLSFSSLQQSASSSSSSSTATLTVEQERLYQQLGPIPHIDAPYVYHVDDLRDVHNMTLLRLAYQRDGVVAIRGLIDDSEQLLLQRLDVASARHVQEQWNKQLQKTSKIASGRPRKARQGTQFFTNLNHLALTDPPFPSLSASSANNSCSSGDNKNETQLTCLEAEDGDQSNGTINNIKNANNIVTMNPFLETALLSQIPIMAATLLGLTDDTISSSSSSSDSSGDHNDQSNNQNQNNDSHNNLRLIRDIFLAKDDDPYICGWHVDDFGFWPVTPTSPPGINAWIALDDYDIKVDGGGFAVAVGSHTASWRHEAHYVTGASTTAPVEGYVSAKDLFERRTGSGTCNLKLSAPHLQMRMEETMRIYPQLRFGDVVLHDRWLFHRTVPLNQNFIEQQQQRQQDQNDHDDDSSQTPPPPILRRYSLRYGPGNSVIPPGFGTELSVLYDDANGGKTANQVCSSNSRIDVNNDDNSTTMVYYPWYPQAWPNVLWESELQSLQSLVQLQFPVALQQQERHLKEMKPHRKRLARQQNRPTLAGNQK